MGLLAVERVSTRWGRVGDRAAAAAGTEDVEPCQVAAPGAVGEGAWCSCAEAGHKSHLQAAVKWAAASGLGVGLGHPGEGTWQLCGLGGREPN